MVSFGHTAIGVVIGISAEKYFVQGNLITGLITTGGIGVLSHYIADFIPHGHFAMPKGFKKGILKIIIFDLFLSIALFLGIIYLKTGISSTFLYVLFGIGGSQLPDVLGGLVAIKAIKAKGLLKVENAIHIIGFNLLILLAIIVTVKDASAFKGVFSNLFHKIF